MSSDIDIGQITEALNDKMDRDGVNAECPTLLSRTPNSQGGVVEIWSDGYCVQTGCGTFPSATNIESSIYITLTESYIDTNYVVTAIMGSGSNFARSEFVATKISVNKIRVQYYDTSSASVARASFQYNWRTEGYIR